MKVKTILEVLKEYYIGKSFDVYKGFYEDGTPANALTTDKKDRFPLDNHQLLENCIVKDVICGEDRGYNYFYLSFEGMSGNLMLKGE